MNKFVRGLAVAAVVAAAGGASAYGEPRVMTSVFDEDSVCISGRIVGYDSACGITSMRVDIEDHVLGKSYPKNITINPDGTFSRKIWLPMAQTALFAIEARELYSSLYLEPGGDLEVEIELKAAPEDGGRLNCTSRYGGSLGEMNRAIAEAPKGPRGLVYRMSANMTPKQVSDSLNRAYSRWGDEMEAYIATLPSGSLAAALLRNSVLAKKTTDWFDYAEFDESHGLIPRELYRGYVADVMAADSTILLTSSCSMLLNRLAFSNMLPERLMRVNRDLVNEMVEFVKARGGKFLPDEERFLRRVVGEASADSVHLIAGSDALSTSHYLVTAADRAGFRTELFEELGDKRLFVQPDERNTDAIRDMCGRQDVPLLWQVAECAAKANRFMDADSVDFESYGISHPELLRRITAARAAARAANGPQELPDTEGGRLMRRLIEPYRGRYLLVDFWDTTCGPCRHGIENSREMRDKHRGNPGFGMLFIASENGSPIDAYNKYVGLNLQGEDVMRLPSSDMNKLQELFNFNGIPRYVLIDPEGRVVNGNYSTYEFWEFLKSEGIISQ